MASPIHARILRRIALVAILVICVPSCGSNQQPCYSVHGEVFAVQGNERVPAAGAIVVFHPASSSSGDAVKPTAHVGDDGKFSLTTYADGDGAPVGDYSVTIEWFAPRPPPPYKPTQAGDKLKGRYASPATTSIRYSVEKDKDNNMAPIELKLP